VNSLDISIVVACRNESGHIETFLDSLSAQDLSGFTWEAILADGISNDGTRELLEERCRRDERLRVIDNPGRIVSTGLNEAIRLARGEVVLRMDAHTVYASDYCRQCVETLRRTGAANVGGPARTRATGVISRAIAAAFHSPFSTGGAKFHDVTYEGPVDTVPFGCWRRSTLLEAGLFDTDLARNQDDELNLRLRLAGGRIWQSRRIVCWYSPRAKMSGLFWQYFQYGFWKVAVLRKHGHSGSWRHLAPSAFIAANVLLAVASAAWPAAREAWLGIGGIYAVTSAAASVHAARRHGCDTLPYLPIVFVTYHAGYGLGYLCGIWRFARPGRPGVQASDSRFVRITR
jgi:succinoglycan biosynthesis protein ExoA